MLFYYLSQHPEVYSKLRKAVRDKFKQPEDVTYYKLRDVDYLEWCLNETTRMYAPDGCAALRQLASDTYLDNIPLTKGTGLQV